MIFIISLMLLSSTYASEKEEAVRHTTKAIMKYPQFKIYKDNLEDLLLRKIPLDRDVLGVLGGVAISTSRGYIASSSIKKIKIDIFSAGLKPDIYYNFRNNEIRYIAGINWEY